MMFFDVIQQSDEYKALRLGKICGTNFSDLLGKKSNLGYEKL